MESSGVTWWSGPAVVDEELCPTCGKPYEDPPTIKISRPVEPSPWTWVLVVVGLYLVVAFGAQALNVYPSLPSSKKLTDCTSGLAAVTVGLDQCDPTIQDIELFEHAIALAAIGAVALLLGLGRIAEQARQELPGLHPTRHARKQRFPGARPFAALFKATWTLGETLFVPCFQTLLLVTFATCIAWLAQGELLSWDLVNTALDRTLDVALALMWVVAIPPLRFL